MIEAYRTEAARQLDTLFGTAQSHMRLYFYRSHNATGDLEEAVMHVIRKYIIPNFYEHEDTGEQEKTHDDGITWFQGSRK